MSFLDRASSFQRSGFERAPFVFCYDISSPRQARAVLKRLRAWRLDGQLSLHEVVITPPQAEELGAQLLELINPETDSLILFRLSRRGDGPVYALARTDSAAPLACQAHPVPNYPGDGWFVVSYDIRDARRLKQVQRVTSGYAAYLQRSVYLFCGPGSQLKAMTAAVLSLLEHGEDDMRLYPLSGPDDLWFLCGDPPPVVGAGMEPLSPREWPGLSPAWL